MEILVVAVILWIVPLFVGHSIGKSKERHGFWWAFFLGWLGVLAVYMLPSLRRDMTYQEQLAFIEQNPRGHSKAKVEAARSEVQAKMHAELAVATRECPHCKEAMRRDGRLPALPTRVGGVDIQRRRMVDLAGRCMASLGRVCGHMGKRRSGASGTSGRSPG